MNRKSRMVILCTACMAIMVIVAGVCGCMAGREEELQWADNCSQIELFVEFQAGTERINSWQNEKGEYLFFLPAGAADCRVTFGNLRENSSVSLDGQAFERGDDLREHLDVLISSKEKKILRMENVGAENESVFVRFLQSENIPAMFIDTASGTLENLHSAKETKEGASLRLWDSEGENCYNDAIEYIKGHGNSTWTDYAKKSYQIKLFEKEALSGMPKAKKWILLSNVLDDTSLKNEIIFRYAEKYTKVASVKGEFTDLYINGDYVGNYYLCEKIEVTNSRLNITDLETATEKVNQKKDDKSVSFYVSEDENIKAAEGLNNPADITGGYLLEHIPAEEYGEENNAFRTGTGHCYAIKSPDPATVEQAEYICRLLNEAEEAMEQEDLINPATRKHISEYLDLESWASKYVMEEVFYDVDAMIGRSMYMYKDSDSIDPLIHAGPMWDYDRALGSYGVRDYNMDDPKQVREYGVYGDKLLVSPEITKLVYQKFEEEMVPYIENKAKADISELNQRIKKSAEMDRERWNKAYGYYIDREASVEYLTYFLKEKSDYLKDVWLGEDDYCTLTFLDYYGNVYKQYKIKKGERFAKAPDIATFVAVFAGWYKQGEDIPYVPDLPVLEDATYESHWIDLEIILQNGLGAAEMDISQIDPELFENIADTIRRMQEENAAQEVSP